MVAALANAVRTTLRGGLQTLQHAGAVHFDFANDQACFLRTLAFVLGFPVRNGGEQELLQANAGLARAEAQQVERFEYVLATDRVGHQTHFAW